MRIIIKGAGDIATGIACRLKNSGFDILMTEMAAPTTVRRMVAFSRAVYEKTAAVEGIEAQLVTDIKEIEEVQKQDKIAVVVDAAAYIIGEYRPEILIDAILAKRNTGTGIDQAPFVVGVGPGFNAGKDCHAVIETKRGHYLGKVIWDGAAAVNTGIPGEIGGYSTERLIRAEAAGEFHPLRSIGDMVREGDAVAESGGVIIQAQINGRIRGMLQAGVAVTAGMKAGDIDPRGELEHCFTISDKARAVGGGVLEAVCGYIYKSKGEFTL